MSGFFIYFIFATSVALLACYEIMRPALYQLRDRPEDTLSQHKFIAHFVMFCISWVTAPLTIIAIMVPSLHERVVQGITQKSE